MSVRPNLPSVFILIKIKISVLSNVAVQSPVRSEGRAELHSSVLSFTLLTAASDNTNYGTVKSAGQTVILRWGYRLIVSN